MDNCPLCSAQHEKVLWSNDALRIILVDDISYPGFCRVILNRHVKEMTDLAPAERAVLMTAVFAVEQVLRDLMQPEKINLASLGNVVPHLHWHVIPRFRDDAHFPDAVWAVAHRTPPYRAVDTAALRNAISARMQSA
jgi:diadenosine tetraphosphate (Ap4A) HIT family hydrolase